MSLICRTNWAEVIKQGSSLRDKATILLLWNTFCSVLLKVVLGQDVQASDLHILSRFQQCHEEAVKAAASDSKVQEQLTMYQKKYDDLAICLCQAIDDILTWAKPCPESEADNVDGKITFVSSIQDIKLPCERMIQAGTQIH